MKAYSAGEGILHWFAANVPGKPESSFLISGERATEPTGRVWCLGTLRLGLPHRDVDLFTFGEEVDVGPREMPPGVTLDHMTFKSRVDGEIRCLEKLRATSAEGRVVTLTTNPLRWYLDINEEYRKATALLLEGGEVAREYLRLRAEGRKAEARALLPIRMSEERG